MRRRKTRTLGVMATTRLLALILLTGVTVVSSSQPTPERKSSPDPVAQAVAVGVLAQTAALKRLRAGDTQGAISILESALDSNLMILSGLPSAPEEPGITNIVRNAAEYRHKYPRKTSYPELDAQISRYLEAHRTK
jgi:hypothetical protein